MFKLVIKKTGKIYQELLLKDKEEFFVGRAKDSDVVLPAEHGISRKHLQLKQVEDNKWQIVNLSQGGSLVLDGTEVTEGILEIGKSVYIQHYELCLVKENNIAKKSELDEAEKDAVDDSSDMPVYSGTQSALKDSVEPENKNEIGATQEQVPEANLALANNMSVSKNAEDATKVMDVQSHKKELKAYLKISATEGAMADIFQLDSDQSEWIVGRDLSADVMIDNPNISRKHFKIKQIKSVYFIKDLKSSNGIMLNEEELSPSKYYPLQSGDILYIIDTEVTFEIKNLALAKEIASLKLPAKLSPSQDLQLAAVHEEGSPAPYMSAPLPTHIPGAVIESPQEDIAPPSFFARSKKRIMIYGSIVAVLAFFLMPNKKETETDTDSPVASQDIELNGLSSDQQEYVKNAYHMAKQFFSRKQFVSCQNEIKKIHQYIDAYQDSKKLGSACSQAAAHERVKIALEEKKKKAAETEQRIRSITQKCQKEFSTFKYRYQLENCLQAAVELAPADGEIQALFATFDANEMKKQEEAQKIAARKAKIKKIRKKYLKAQALHKSGQIEKSMSAYQHFIKISKHKELMKDRTKAGRELANIKESYHNNINHLNSQCAEAIASGNFKNAYYVCKKAYEKIPEPHNQKALQLMDKARISLQSKMKKYYEEASLHESAGHISKAQDFWKNILDQDVDAGVYYEKAKIKMDKY